MASPSSSPKSVVIVGGGLIGLTTAFFLQERGAAVTIIDAGTLGGGASKGNAGLVCTALVEPLAGPGAITTALKSLADPAGALRMKPLEFPKLTPWLLRFAKFANSKAYHKGRLALGAFNARTPELFRQLRAAGVDGDTGPALLVAMHKEADAEKFRHELELMRQFSAIVPPKLLSAAEIHNAVPALTDHIQAGFFLDNDLPLDPRSIVDSLLRVLRSRGVRLVESQPVTALASTGSRVSSVTLKSGERLSADEFVIAAGAGAHKLGMLFDLNIPVIAGQGYNFMVPSIDNFNHAVIFQDAHFVATPLGDGIRLGGTMELTGDNPQFDQRRVDAIVRSAKPLVRFDFEKRATTWSGLRPLTADGMPILGRASKWSNLSLAVGHGMYGLTLAPTTALAMAELLIDGRSSLDISPFSPKRLKL